MRISTGDPTILLQRPISLGLLIARRVVAMSARRAAGIRSKREEAFQE